jgi:hypothetical protein
MAIRIRIEVPRWDKWPERPELVGPQQSVRASGQHKDDRPPVRHAADPGAPIRSDGRREVEVAAVVARLRLFGPAGGDGLRVRIEGDALWAVDVVSAEQ